MDMQGKREKIERERETKNETKTTQNPRTGEQDIHKRPGAKKRAVCGAPVAKVERTLAASSEANSRGLSPAQTASHAS